MAARFCYMCGNPLPESARFCVSCGTPVDQTPAPAEPAPVTTPDPEPIPEPVAVLDSEPVSEPVAEPDPEPVPEPVAEPDPEPIPEPVFEQPVPTPVYTTGPQPDYIQPEEQEKPKKERYKKRGVLRTIVAVPLCILVFLFATMSLVVWDAASLLDSENLAKAVTDTVENIDLTEIKAVDVLGDSMEVEDQDASIVEWAITEIAKTSEGTIEVSKKDVEKFLKESTIPAFLNETVASYADALLGDGEDAGVTKKELTKLFEENAELAEEVFDVQIGDEEIEYFVDSLEENGIMEMLEPGTIEKTMKNEMGETFSILKNVSKYTMLLFVLLVALTVLFIVLLSANNRWNMLRTSGDVGILLTILGVVTTAVALSGTFIGDILPLGEMVVSVMESFLMSTLVPALITLGAGVLLILVYVIGKSIIIKSAKKQV